MTERTLVAVVPKSTPQGSIVWYADTRRAMLPDIIVLNDCIFRALGLQEYLPEKNHLVWFALIVNGQMVAKSH